MGNWSWTWNSFLSIKLDLFHLLKNHWFQVKNRMLDYLSCIRMSWITGIMTRRKFKTASTIPMILSSLWPLLVELIWLLILGGKEEERVQWLAKYRPDVSSTGGQWSDSWEERESSYSLVLYWSRLFQLPKPKVPSRSRVRHPNKIKQGCKIRGLQERGTAEPCFVYLNYCYEY